MTIFRFAAFAAASVAMASIAHAADATVSEPGGFNWSGFYAGIGAGAGGSVTELGIPALGGTSFDGIGGEGVFGEVTIGYDHVFGDRFLAGVFAGAQFGTVGTSLDIPALPLEASFNARYGFDAGARLGYLINPTTLGYVLGGYSWRNFQLDTNVPGLGADWDAGGYVVGLGMETALSGNLTLKGEYRFASYGNVNYLSALGVPAGLLDANTSTHTFHAGLNYRFGAANGGGAAFETPAYDWTGVYVSATAGAGMLSHEIETPIIPGGIAFNGIGAEGVFGEAGIGYDHDFGGFVAGIAANGRISSVATTLNLAGAIKASIDADYGFDLLLRAGAKLNRSTLAYVIGGYSMQHFEINIDQPALGTLYDWTAHGFSVGGGLEAALSSRTTASIEYRYSQYGSEDFGSAGLITATPSSHTVRAGLKLKLF
jgi:outer membrane immunogenic protein